MPAAPIWSNASTVSRYFCGAYAMAAPPARATPSASCSGTTISYPLPQHVRHGDGDIGERLRGNSITAVVDRRPCVLLTYRRPVHLDLAIGQVDDPHLPDSVACVAGQLLVTVIGKRAARDLN